MKRALILCCLLLLSACIDVDDYGDYWDKATIDPSLAGRWVKLAENEDGDITDKPSDQQYSFTLKNGAYAVQSYVNGKASDDDPLYPIKTLQLGHYKFLALGPTKGSLLRYEIKGDEITWYVADPDKAWEFISQKYPDQNNIYRDEPDEDDTPEEARDRPLYVGTMDDEAAKIISSIPNNEIYWDPDTVTRRVK